MQACRKVLFLLMISASLVATVGRDTRADLLLALTSNGTSGVFQVGVNGEIDIPIYLVQTNGENRLTSQGIFAGGSTLNYFYQSGSGDALTGNASIAGVTVASQLAFFPVHFTDIDNTSGNQFAILEGGVSQSPVVPLKPTGGSNSIQIGSVKFSAGSLGNVTGLALSLDRNLLNANLLYDINSMGTPLGTMSEPLAFGGGTLTTIAPVPEPTTLILLSGGAIVALRTQRLRRAKISKAL